MKAGKSLESRNLNVIANIENEPEGKRYISGCIPYNSRSQFMYVGYSDCNYELLSPTVFNKTISDHADVYVNYAHNDEHILGRLSAGTLELTNTPDGLLFRMQVPNTPWGDEAYGTIESGNCRTISFEFVPYTWKEDFDSNTVTLTSAKLIAISLCVVNPAYLETDTFTSIRSITDKLKREGKDLEPETIKDIINLVDELKKFIPEEQKNSVEENKEEQKEEVSEEKPAEEKVEQSAENSDENKKEENSAEPEEVQQQETPEQSQPDTPKEVTTENTDAEYAEKIAKLTALVGELENLMQ